MKRLSSAVLAAAFALVTVACGQTDSGITAAVKTKFAADDLVKAHDINVTTQNHVVTLEGEVATTAAKERAIDLARGAKGVRDVNDHLQVRDTAATSGDDYDLGQDIERGLDKTGDAIKKGAEATGDAAKKAGRAVRDAVTDRDRDSDNDGK